MDVKAESSGAGKKTLREIFDLLQSCISDFTSESESLAQLARKPKLEKSQSLPENSLYMPVKSKSDSRKIYKEVEKQHLDLTRENIQHKETLQNVKLNLDKVNKRIGRNQTNIDDEVMQELTNIRKLLENFTVSQKDSDKKLDKICCGIEEVCKMRDEPYRTASSNQVIRLPLELADVCSYIHAKGFNSRQLASELGIGEDKIGQIEAQYEDEEERLRTVLFEWTTGSHHPKVSTLVKACSNLDHSILTVTPLSKQDTTVLERNMPFFIEEMMEVSLLIPYLTADGLLSLKSRKYITDKKTRPERILALLDILSTYERGLDALISALDKTEQRHISDRLKDFRKCSDDTLTSNTKRFEQETKSEIENVNETGNDNTEAGGLLSWPVTDKTNTKTMDILQQISQLLKRAGIND